MMDISQDEIASIRYVLKMARNHAVTEPHAYYVDPHAIPLFEEQQRNFHNVETILEQFDGEETE